MSPTAEPAPAPAPSAPLLGSAEASPAGPITAAELAELAAPPEVPLPRSLQVLRFTQRQIEFVFKSRRKLGGVFRFDGLIAGNPVVTDHPDHVRSLFTASPDLAPSLTAESPLRPIVGPASVLTANGPRHMRQRKLLLPPFHGEAIARYATMISEVTEREIDTWEQGEEIKLANRMQAITLDVIMSGIFGIDGEPEKGSPERALRTVIQHLTTASTMPVAQLSEIFNVGRDEPVGLMKRGIGILDRATYAVIEGRRAGDLSGSTDILSLILQAQTEDGEHLSDREVRDELLTLVLAGFETTANSLAWTWERLVRTPGAHDRLREVVRGSEGAESEAYVEATIQEGMRSRPVIPMIGRRVTVPWQLGDYGVAADTPISMSILLVHHRPDIYPQPFHFIPERWLEGPTSARKPGTYEWIPFGGGTRRCLGAALAMAEQRVVLEAMARRLDLVAVRSEPEHAQHRNVTMIPADGARVRVAAKRS